LPEGSSLEELLLKRHVYPEIMKIIDRDFLPGKRGLLYMELIFDGTVNL
jgi:hypothetical protein